VTWHERFGSTSQELPGTSGGATGESQHDSCLHVAARSKGPDQRPHGSDGTPLHRCRRAWMFRDNSGRQSRATALAHPLLVHSKCGIRSSEVKTWPRTLAAATSIAARRQIIRGPLPTAAAKSSSLGAP